MSDSRLLPTGSSPLEVAAAKACAEIEKTPVSIRELWNPDTCPANLLPWLAWAFSVDRWDEKWPEATKRAVIRDAHFIHCHKGTTHQRPEAAKAEGKTETQKERETPARTGAPESETSQAEESAKSTGSARR